MRQHIQTPKPRFSLAFLITNYVSAALATQEHHYELRIGITPWDVIGYSSNSPLSGHDSSNKRSP
ncbi:MAG: hypothetical protein V7L21_09460 [Nostoc sp.]